MKLGSPKGNARRRAPFADTPTAERFRQRCGFLQRIAFYDLVAAMMTGLSALRMRATSACNASSRSYRVSTRVERPRSMPASELRISPAAR